MGSSCSKSRSVDIVQGQRPVRRVSGTHGRQAAPTGIQDHRPRNKVHTDPSKNESAKISPNSKPSRELVTKVHETHDGQNNKDEVEATVLEDSKDEEAQSKETIDVIDVKQESTESTQEDQTGQSNEESKSTIAELQESRGEENAQVQVEATVPEEARDRPSQNKEATDVTDVVQESKESTKNEQTSLNNEPSTDTPVEVHETSDQQSDQVQLEVATKEVSTDRPVESKEHVQDNIVEQKAPARRTKKDLIPDVDVYKDLDERAVKAPEGHATIRDLVSYLLIEPAKTPLERARVLFRWVTSHIEYDVVSYVTGGSTDNTPEGVFKNRMSVCQGYADLYTEMCRCAEVKCVTISGRSKGGSYRVGDKFGPGSDHAWNAVEIDGRWYLLDCTWAAGNTDMQKRTFEFAYKEHYFFTDPEVFVMDHHPMDNKWQMLEEPVPLEVFENQVHLKSSFFSLALLPSFLSNTSSPVHTQNGEAKISIKIPEPMAFMYHLFPYEGGSSLDENVLHETVVNAAIFKVVLSIKGKFLLEIYGKRGTATGRHSQLCSYVVECDVPSPNHVPFPCLNTFTWGPGPWLLDEFMTDVSHPNAIVTLPEGEAKITFSACKPLQYKCQINDDKYYRDEYAFFQVNDREVSVYVRAPETGQFTLTIWAKEENDQKFNKCIYYLLKCNKCKASVSPFPKTFNNWTNGCQLYEPLDGRLAANWRVHFRVTCPNAVEVVVIAGQWHKLTKSADGSWEGEADTGQPDSILKVSTKMLGDTQYWTLLQYEVVG